MKPLYVRYVELKNKRARLNGFEDYGHEMRDEYEVPGWEDDVLRYIHCLLQVNCKILFSICLQHIP